MGCSYILMYNMLRLREKCDIGNERETFFLWKGDSFSRIEPPLYTWRLSQPLIHSHYKLHEWLKFLPNFKAHRLKLVEDSDMRFSQLHREQIQQRFKSLTTFLRDSLVKQDGVKQWFIFPVFLKLPSSTLNGKRRAPWTGFLKFSQNL